MNFNILTTIIEGIATMSVDGKCLFCLYQPKIPQELLEKNIAKGNNTDEDCNLR